MKRLSFLWVILFCLLFENVWAHQDFWTAKTYGNVKIRVTTGFDYEEIEKTFIIGQLAKQLAENLNYSSQIFLDFKHHYTENCIPAYFVSYDKGKIEYTWSGASKENDYLKTNAIVIRQVSREFNVIATLQLLEYAIRNTASIRANQKKIDYNKNYCQWRINSVDTLLLKEQLQKPWSAELSEVVKLRVERPDYTLSYGISYYWQDNKFHVFSRTFNKPDTTLISLDRIYLFERLSNQSAMVFDSDSSFYYIRQYRKHEVSQRHVIKNVFDNYRPFTIQDIGGEKLSIYFSCYTNETGLQPKERTLIYRTHRDELIQDLDVLLDSK